MCRSSTTSLASATIEKEVAPNSMDDSIHSTGTMNELLNPTLPTPDNSKYTMGNDTVLNLLIDCINAIVFISSCINGIRCT